MKARFKVAIHRRCRCHCRMSEAAGAPELPPHAATGCCQLLRRGQGTRQARWNTRCDLPFAVPGSGSTLAASSQQALTGPRRLSQALQGPPRCKDSSSWSPSTSTPGPPPLRLHRFQSSPANHLHHHHHHSPHHTTFPHPLLLVRLSAAIPTSHQSLSSLLQPSRLPTPCLTSPHLTSPHLPTSPDPRLLLAPAEFAPHHRSHRQPCVHRFPPPSPPPLLDLPCVSLAPRPSLLWPSRVTTLGSATVRRPCAARGAHCFFTTDICASAIDSRALCDDRQSHRACPPPSETACAAATCLRSWKTRIDIEAQ